MPPTGDVSPKRTSSRKLQDKNKTSKVKKLVSVAVMPGGYIHRWRRPLLRSVRATPGGTAGVPEAPPRGLSGRGLSTLSCSGCRSRAPCSGSSRRSAGRGRQAVSSQRPLGRAWAGDPLPDPVGSGWRPPGGQLSQLSEPPSVGGIPKQSRSAPLTMITATTMAAMPMRYSFPEKSSSIFPWQSSCRGGQRAVRGACPPTL